MRTLVVGLVFVAVAPTTLAQPSQLFHTGVASFGAHHAGSAWYGLELETKLGADANGDGDTGDVILRVIDPVTHTVTSLPFAVGFSANFIAAGGDFEAFAISEVDQGQGSLNGDIDTLDDVLAIRRVSTGVITIVPIAVTANSISMAPDGSIATAAVFEQDQGISLNGDGDKVDHFVVVVHPVSGTWSVVAPVAATVPSLRALSGGDIVFDELESSVGIDVNGDGDKQDDVPRVWHSATGTIATLPLPLADVTMIVGVTPSENAFVYVAGEAAQSVDLNGDGDRIDAVPVIVDRATNAFTSAGVAVAVVNAFSGVSFDDLHVVSPANEAKNGHDSNGDGDLLDTVPFVTDVATGQTVNVGEAIQPATLVRLGDGFVAYEILENAASPGVDSNGDGDAWDAVPTVYVIATGTRVVVPISMPLPLPSSPLTPFQAVGSQLFITADEALGAGTDFNFDGDGQDQCAFVFDVPSRRLMNLSRTAVNQGLLAPGSTQVGFEMSEEGEGGQSLNGDPDHNDRVAAIYDSKSGALFETGLAEVSNNNFYPVTTGTESIVSVSEGDQGSDEDGDGALTHVVDALYTPVVDGCGRFDLYGQGCPTSAGKIPELEAHGCAIPGGPIRLQVRRGIPGQHAFLVLGAGQGSAPLGGGCTLLVAPVLPVVFGPVFLPSNGLFGGAALVATTIPAAAIPGMIAVQAFVTDPVLLKGYAASNGLELTVAP